MKTFLGLVLMLTLSSALWAQGDADSPLCSQRQDGPIDTGCNNFTSACPPEFDHGCQASEPFTALCNGNYDIDAWLTKDGAGGLTDCKVCVYVKDMAGNVKGQCVLDVCAENAYVKTCAGAANLVAGNSYRIYVCLTYCGAYTSSVNHCANSTAHGCVRYNTTATCYPQP